MKANKKKYYSPAIEVYSIDKSICLVMTSENTGPGDGDWGDVSTVSTQSEPLQQNNFESNPFEESK